MLLSQLPYDIQNKIVTYLSIDDIFNLIFSDNNNKYMFWRKIALTMKQLFVPITLKNYTVPNAPNIQQWLILVNNNPRKNIIYSNTYPDGYIYYCEHVSTFKNS